MRNMTVKVDKGVMTITVPVDANTLKGATPSATGKTKIVASSGGNQPIALPTGETLFIGFNAYIK